MEKESGSRRVCVREIYAEWLSVAFVDVPFGEITHLQPAPANLCIFVCVCVHVRVHVCLCVNVIVSMQIWDDIKNNSEACKELSASYEFTYSARFAGMALGRVSVFSKVYMEIKYLSI